jgi:hypothetical protein
MGPINLGMSLREKEGQEILQVLLQRLLPRAIKVRVGRAQNPTPFLIAI